MNWKLCFVIVSLLLSISLHAQETEEELKIIYEGRRDSVFSELKRIILPPCRIAG